MFGRIIRTLAGLAALSWTPAMAQGCLTPGPLEISDLATAGLVVRGRVVDYQRVDRRAEHLDAYFGRILIDVTETWRGDERARWELYWTNGTLPLPEDWQHGDDVVVAAIAVPPGLERLLSGSAGGGGDGTARMLVLQRDCARPFIFATRAPENEVAAWRRETDGLRAMLKQMPSESMRQRVERMLGADPEKTHRRRVAALRACVDEDMDTCKAVWRDP